MLNWIEGDLVQKRYGVMNRLSKGGIDQTIVVRLFLIGLLTKK